MVIVQKTGSTVVVPDDLLVVLWVLINSGVDSVYVQRRKPRASEKESDMYRTRPVRTKGPAEGGETKAMYEGTSPLSVQWGWPVFYGVHLSFHVVTELGYRCS